MTSPDELPALRAKTGAAWLDLLGTVAWANGPAPVDRLDTLNRLRSWLTAQELRPDTDPTAEDLAHAQALREALRGIALALLRSTTPPADAVALLNATLAEEHRLAVEPADGRLVARAPATARAALARIAYQAAQQLTGPLAAELRLCADDECGLVFLDPGGRRRWCSTEICGVRNRVRALRQRRQG